MNIEELTIKQAREIAALVGGAKLTATPTRDIGQHIVVLDRGFVYAGNVVEESDRITITGAVNIRYWGTKNGLGELVNGPLSGTKIDSVGTVIAYKHAVIHLIPCNGF